MTRIFKPNIKDYKVLTPDGFKSFAGVSLMGIKPILRLEFEHGKWIECTNDHKLYTSLTELTTANNLKIGDFVFSFQGNIRLLDKIQTGRVEPVYDLIEVDGGHKYFANSLLSSNCEFLVFDETLISSIKLADIEGKEPFMKMGQCRWYKKINPAHTYIIALDPSLGTGGDPAAIQVLEIPSFTQVAEWQHNLTTVQAQVRILRDICNYINDECAAKGAQASIYYSVENNTVGEAALVAISEIGEESIPGLFLSEPIKKGHVRRFRKGFNTTHTSKIAICAKLKHLIESNRLKIYSKPLISELKTYVAKGISFEGKVGSTDDLVSSLLLALRMIIMLQDWDPAIYDKMREEREDEFIMPMPIYISNY
jgi:intein/homing endonuclease